MTEAGIGWPIHPVWVGLHPRGWRNEVWADLDVGLDVRPPHWVEVTSGTGKVVASYRGSINALGLSSAEGACCVLSQGAFACLAPCATVTLRLVAEPKPAVMVSILYLSCSDMSGATERARIKDVIAVDNLVGCVASSECSLAVGWGDGHVTMRVTETTPVGPVMLTSSTTVRVAPEIRVMQGETLTKEKSPVAEELAEVIRRCHDGRDFERGVIVTGPTGSGKTHCCRRALQAVGSPVVEMSILSLLKAGSGERRMRAGFAEVLSLQPASIFMEGIDSLRGEARITTALIEALDVIHEDPRARICFLATATSHQAVDTKLVSPARLFQHIRVPSPSRGDRQLLLASFLAGLVSPSDRVQLGAEVADRTPGFLPADLQRVIAVARLQAVRRPRSSRSQERIHREDLLHACRVVSPSVLASCLWWRAAPEDDGTKLYGLEKEEQLLHQCIQLLLSPISFSPVGIVRGALVSGPSGCGKSALIRRVASKAGGSANVIMVSAAEVVSAVPGETERAVRDLFRFARAASPSILILENVEILAPARTDGNDESNDHFRRVLTVLMTILDGVGTEEAEGRVLVLATTTDPEEVDPALLRPGRIELSIPLKKMDAAATNAILEEELGNQVNVKSILPHLADQTGAYVRGFCREVRLQCFRRQGLTPLDQDVQSVLNS